METELEFVSKEFYPMISTRLALNNLFIFGTCSGILNRWLPIKI